MNFYWNHLLKAFRCLCTYKSIYKIRSIVVGIIFKIQMSLSPTLINYLRDDILYLIDRIYINILKESYYLHSQIHEQKFYDLILCFNLKRKITFLRYGGYFELWDKYGLTIS